MGLAMAAPSTTIAKMGSLELPVSSPEPSQGKRFFGRFRFIGGPTFLFMQKQTYVSAGGAVRYAFSPTWSLEGGGFFQKDADLDFRRVEKGLPDGSDFRARVESLNEFHVAVHCRLPFGNFRWVVPEAGFGVSVLGIRNVIEKNNPRGFPAFQRASPYTISTSPVILLGAYSLDGSPVSLGLEVGYASYHNTPESWDEAFDLRLSGFIVRPTLVVRL